MSSNGNFKSLTEAYDNLKNSTFGQHFATVDKPATSENQASKSIELTFGLKGFIGLNESIQEAFYLYMEGPLVTAELGLLAMKNTSSAICTASANINAAMEWGTTDIGIAGVKVDCTVTGHGSDLGQVHLHGMTSSLVLTFQKASDMAALIPGIDVAG